MVVPTDTSVIQYRFKNQVDTEKLSIPGATISIRELKGLISQRHKLDQKSSRPDKTQAPAELFLENEATGEVYGSDETEVARGIVVTVSRKLAGAEPVIREEPKQVAAVPDPPKSAPEKPGVEQNDSGYYGGGGYGYNKGPQGLEDPTFVEKGFPSKILESTDISEIKDMSEEDKILAMMYQAMLFYDHTHYIRVPRSGPWQCQECKGHHPRNKCPLQNQNDTPYDRPHNRRNTHPRQPTVTPTTATVNPNAYQSVPDDTYDYEDLDPELRCGLGQHILRDAVQTPCCSANYCEQCIREYLVANEDGGFCPKCHDPLAPDACMENSFVRDRVRKWEREAQSRRQRKKEDSSGNTSAKSGGPVKEEPSSSRNFATPGQNIGSIQSRLSSGSRTMPLVKSEPHSTSSVKTEHHASDTKPSSAQPIGSLVSGTNRQNLTTLFSQQQQPAAQPSTTPASNTTTLTSGETRRPGTATPFQQSAQAGALGMNAMNPMFINSLTGAGARPTRPQMGFGVNQFDSSAFGFGFANRFEMDPAALMRRGINPYMMQGMHTTGFLGNQSVDMYNRAVRFNSGAASTTNILPNGETLRITRKLNPPSGSPSESTSSRSADKSREKDRDDYRRKDDDRRSERKSDSKYDDRSRRDDRKKREGSHKSDHDDRRSSERRHSRERRSRNDSSDRKKDKEVKKEKEKERLSRTELEKPPDRLAEKEARKERQKENGTRIMISTKPKPERPTDQVTKPSEGPVQPLDIKPEKEQPTPIPSTNPAAEAAKAKAAAEEAARQKQREEKEKAEKEAEEKKRKEEAEKEERKRKRREKELDRKEKELKAKEQKIAELDRERIRKEAEFAQKQAQETARLALLARAEMIIPTVPVKDPAEIAAETQKKAFGKWANEDEEGLPKTPTGPSPVKVLPVVAGDTPPESKDVPAEKRAEKKSHKSRSKKEKRKREGSVDKKNKRSRREHRAGEEGEITEKERKSHKDRLSKDGVDIPEPEKVDGKKERPKHKSSKSKYLDESARSSREKRPRSESSDKRGERDSKKRDLVVTEVDEGKISEKHRKKDREEKTHKSRSKKEKPSKSVREERLKLEEPVLAPDPVVFDARSVINERKSLKIDKEEKLRSPVEDPPVVPKVEEVIEKPVETPKEASGEKRSHRSLKKREKRSKEKQPRPEGEEKESRKKHKKKRRREKRDLDAEDDLRTSPLEADDRKSADKSFFSRIYAKLDPNELRKLEDNHRVQLSTKPTFFPVTSLSEEVPSKRVLYVT